MDVILVVNSGSSSLKFALYPTVENNTEVLLSGEVSSIGVRPILTAKKGGETLAVKPPFDNIDKNTTHASLIEALLERLDSEYTQFNL